MPEPKRKIKKGAPEERKPEEREEVFEERKPEKRRLPEKRRFHVVDNADEFAEKITKAAAGMPEIPEGGAGPKEEKRYRLTLLNGEKIILSRKTKVAKKPGKETYETDETPYGRINVINDDLMWRTNPVRKAHYDGMLFLTNKRLVHVIKQGWAPWAKYTTDFDRPLSTLHNAAAETGDGWKRKFRYPGKRLAVQYYKGEVNMFGDTILAQRGGTPVEEREGDFKERELRELLEVKLERLKSGKGK